MLRPDQLTSEEPLKWSVGRGVDVWDLFTACIAGDLDAVRQLVALEPGLVRTHYAYRTPLYFAVRENRVDVVKFLLEHGADPLSLAVNDSLLDICRDRGYAELQCVLELHLAKSLRASPEGEPLAAAIRAHDMAGMKNLLDAAPALVHMGDGRSNQPIHWASMTRQLDMIDELLSRGADVNAVRFDGARPVQLVNGDYHFRGWRDVPQDWPTSPQEVLDHLRARGADVDICSAAYIGDIDRVRELLAADPTLANHCVEYVSYYLGSGSPLKNAAARGHLEIVELLLANGADPNLPEEGIAPNGHALYAAAANKHHDIAKLLLERGAYPNPEVESSADALSRAISNDDQPMIELLCSYGAACKLHLLGYHGDVRTAAAMFAANPAAARDPEALANAAGEGQLAFVQLMLRFEPTLPARTSFPSWLVAGKTREINDLLYAHGMSPSQQDWLLATPLHQFARTGDVERATWFLDAGADLHARDEDIRSTPLGWAAKFGQRAMVELLLDRGAQVNHPDDPPWATPLAWATRRGHAEIADLLRQRGANS
jgi:ankyrin repeat protein